jgi:DNA ligase (NAD+)
MLSLNDIFTLEELQAWENRWRDFYVKQYGVYPASWQTSLQYVIEPKVDGLAISLHYEGGILQRALTRGDGWVGELVTENVKQVADIPKQIPDLRKIEVRGEIFITKANFEELNKQILEGKQVGRFGKSGPEGVFANPRNAASGTIRQLDSSVVAQRNLSFIAYGIWIDEN